MVKHPSKGCCFPKELHFKKTMYYVVFCYQLLKIRKLNANFLHKHNRISDAIHRYNYNYYCFHYFKAITFNCVLCKQCFYYNFLSANRILPMLK